MVYIEVVNIYKVITGQYMSQEEISSMRASDYSDQQEEISTMRATDCAIRQPGSVIQVPASVPTGYMFSISEHESYDVPMNIISSAHGGVMVTVRISPKMFLAISKALFGKFNEIDFSSDQLTDRYMRTAIEHVNKIGVVGSRNVVFNFECCGGFASHVFESTQLSPLYLACIAKFVKSNYTFVFADYSLYALINTWTGTNTSLGACPFKIVGKCSGTVKLAYSKQKLLECNVNQLRVMGEISEDCTGMNFAQVHTLPNTIVFDINGTISPEYTLDVLTSVENNNDVNALRTVGHACITYKDGGKIIVSAVHFCELSKIKCSRDGILRAIERLPPELRESYATAYRASEQYTGEERDTVIARFGADLLRSSSS